MKLRLGLPLAAVLISMMALAPIVDAAEPAPGYTQFAGCPSPEENPAVFACLNSEITGGHFQMGSKDVPITQPMTLSAGIDESTGALYANAKGGLSQAKQKVPGGVVGLTGLTWLFEVLGSEALTLYAVTELAGQPFMEEEQLTLPIKVHLINGVLGNSCYVGTASEPITLHLTTGTTNPPSPNTPITGSRGQISIDPTYEIIHQTNIKYVENSFAAPGAHGCVLHLFGFIPINLDGVVNLQSGLPSPAGKNETVQEADAELAFTEAVYP